MSTDRMANTGIMVVSIGLAEIVAHEYPRVFSLNTGLTTAFIGAAIFVIAVCIEIGKEMERGK